MAHMLVTLDTSHLEMSPLNDGEAGTSHAWNKFLIFFTPETSQDPIGPCGPLEQSAFEESSVHSAMASWSSVLDFGVHPVVGFCDCSHTVGMAWD